MKNKDKLEDLKLARERTLKKIEKVKKKIAEEKENEEAWPGHESTFYLDDVNTLDMLERHLKEIDGQILKLKK